MRELKNLVYILQEKNRGILVPTESEVQNNSLNFGRLKLMPFQLELQSLYRGQLTFVVWRSMEIAMFVQLSWNSIVKHILKCVLVFPGTSLHDLCSSKAQQSPSRGWLTARLRENSWH